MKKIISLLLVLTLALSVLVACKKENDPCETHTDADKNYVCDICGELLPNNALILSEAMIAQLERTKSVKLDLEVSTLSNSERWYVDGNGEAYADGSYSEAINKLNLVVSRSDSGVIGVRLDVSSKERYSVSDEYDELPLTPYLYLVDGTVYLYDESNDVYKKSELDVDLDEIMATVDALTDGVALTAEDKSKLYNALGEYMLTTFSIVENKGTVSVDLKDKANALFSYLAALDLENDTLEDVLNDALALVDENLTAEALINEVFRVLNLNATEAVAELDAWLTEKHSTTLQGIFDKLMANPAVAQLLKNAIKLQLPEGTEDADAQVETAFNEIKSFKLADALTELGDATLYDLYFAYVQGASADEYPPIDDMKAQITAMLGLTLDEFDENMDSGPSFAMIKYLASGITVNELNAKVELQFEGIFKLASANAELNIDITSKLPSSVEGKNDVSINKTKITAKLYDLSEEKAAISAPTDKEVYLNIYEKTYYNDNGDELYIDLNDGEVYITLNLYTDGGTVNVAAGGLSPDVLKSNTITVPGDSLVFSADTSVTYDESTPLTVTVSTSGNSFTIDSIPEYQLIVSVESVLNEIGFGDGVDNSDEYDLSGEFAYVSSMGYGQMRITLGDNFYLESIGATYDIDESTGNMICTVTSFTCDYDHMLWLLDKSAGFYGGENDAANVEAYLGGDITFIIYIEDGVVYTDGIPDVIDEYKYKMS